MKPEPRFGYHPRVADQTAAWAIPEGPEKERFQRHARQYVLQAEREVATEATQVPTTADVTSTLFEYDITGPRVRAIGQATGGYLKEVAENEAAFSYSLQDAVSLYILKTVASSGNPVHLKDLEDIIQDSKGWMRVILLVRGGLLDVVGSEVRATERGIRELEAIQIYCGLQST
jgi:hypothetical protein